MPEPRTTRPGVWPPAPQDAPHSWTVDGTTLTRSTEQLTLHCAHTKWIPIAILAVQTPLFLAGLALAMVPTLGPHAVRLVPVLASPDQVRRGLFMAGFFLLQWLICVYGQWWHYDQLGRGHFTFSRSPNHVLAGSKSVCGLGEIRFLQVRRQFFHVGRRYVVSFVHGDVRRGRYWGRPARAVRNPERQSRILTFFRRRVDAEIVAHEVAAFIGVEVNVLWA